MQIFKSVLLLSPRNQTLSDFIQDKQVRLKRRFCFILVALGPRLSNPLPNLGGNRDLDCSSSFRFCFCFFRFSHSPSSSILWPRTGPHIAAECSENSTNRRCWLMSATVCDDLSQGRFSEYNGRRSCSEFTLEADSCLVQRTIP